jgi:protein-tyrosine-phosphatase/DNA-binding MarR family transcriptional regulator
MVAAPETLDAPSVLQLLAHDLRWRLVASLARSDYHVKELVAFLEQPPNLVSYHLRRLREGQLVRERRSSADGRDIYYSLDLDRLQQLYVAAGTTIHPALGERQVRRATDGERRNAPPTCVLFLCTHNSARSQMAEGILRHLGGRAVEVRSAGSDPASVHPEAVQAMRSLGIDIGAQRATHLDVFHDQRFDYVITVCDRVREICPTFPGDPETVHWSVADPSAVADPEERRRAFEQTAAQLVTRVRYLVTLIERDQQE